MPVLSGVYLSQLWVWEVSIYMKRNIQNEKSSSKKIHVWFYCRMSGRNHVCRTLPVTAI